MKFFNKYLSNVLEIFLLYKNDDCDLYHVKRLFESIFKGLLKLKTIRKNSDKNKTQATKRLVFETMTDSGSKGRLSNKLNYDFKKSDEK